MAAAALIEISVAAFYSVYRQIDSSFPDTFKQLRLGFFKGISLARTQFAKMGLLN